MPRVGGCCSATAYVLFWPHIFFMQCKNEKALFILFTNLNPIMCLGNVSCNAKSKKALFLKSDVGLRGNTENGTLLHFFHHKNPLPHLSYPYRKDHKNPTNIISFGQIYRDNLAFSFILVH